MKPTIPLRNGGARVNTRRAHVAHHCCDGTCQQGRECPLVVQRAARAPLDPVHQRSVVPVHLTGGRIPRARRARRWTREAVLRVTSSRWGRGLIAIAAAAAFIYSLSGDPT